MFAAMFAGLDVDIATDVTFLLYSNDDETSVTILEVISPTGDKILDVVVANVDALKDSLSCLKTEIWLDREVITVTGT